jgi:hypothetical protein
VIALWIFVILLFRPYKDRAGNMVVFLFLCSNLLGIISQVPGQNRVSLQLAFIVSIFCTLGIISVYMFQLTGARIHDTIGSKVVFYSRYSSLERKLLAPILWAAALGMSCVAAFWRKIPSACRAKSLSQKIEMDLKRKEREREAFHKGLEHLPVKEQLRQIREEYGINSKEYRQHLEHTRTGGIAEIGGNVTKVQPIWVPAPPPAPPGTEDEMSKKKKKKKKKNKKMKKKKTKKSKKNGDDVNGSRISLEQESSDDY